MRKIFNNKVDVAKEGSVMLGYHLWSALQTEDLIETVFAFLQEDFIEGNVDQAH